MARDVPGRNPSRVELAEAELRLKTDLAPTPQPVLPDVGGIAKAFTDAAFSQKSPNFTTPGDIEAPLDSARSNLPVPVYPEVRSHRDSRDRGVYTPPPEVDQTPAKLVGGSTRLVLRACEYRVGVEGVVQTIEELEVPSAAAYWIQIDTDENCAVVGATYQYGAEFPASTIASETSPYYVMQSNVPLASNVSGVITQHRVGHFVFAIWDVNGYAARWAETSGGVQP